MGFAPSAVEQADALRKVEERKAYMKAYNATPEAKAARRAAYAARRAKRKAYNATPEAKAKRAAYAATPEVKAYQKAYQKAYYAKKKAGRSL